MLIFCNSSLHCRVYFQFPKKDLHMYQKSSHLHQSIFLIIYHKSFLLFLLLNIWDPFNCGFQTFCGFASFRHRVAKEFYTELHHSPTFRAICLLKCDLLYKRERYVIYQDKEIYQRPCLTHPSDPTSFQVFVTELPKSFTLNHSQIFRAICLLPHASH